MSATTPSKKLQLRTSDLTDFFRGSSSGPSSTSNSLPSSTVLEINTSSSSPSKKRSTRIPFIGRPRKKSTQSDVAVTSDIIESRSSVTTAGSRSILDYGRDQVASLPQASTSQHSLKLAANPTSLGSKIAAHFAPSRSGLRRFQSRRSQRSARPPGDLSDYNSDSLAPPSAGLRSPSIDSNSSRVSRSSTPRPSQASREIHDPRPQPTITVSRPPVDNDPYNLGEYDDLFTKPRHKIKPKPVPIRTGSSDIPELNFPSSLSRRASPHSSSALPTITRSSSVLIAKPDAVEMISRPVTAPRVHKLSQSSATSNADSDRVSISGPSPRGFPSRRRENSLGRPASDLDAAEESEVSVKSVMSMPTSFGSAGRTLSGKGVLEKRRSLATTSIRDSEKLRSRIAQPSRPPTIPLPATPTHPREISPSPVPRQRAHTISAGRTVPLGRSSSSLPRVGVPVQRDISSSKGDGRPPPLAKDPTSQVPGADRNSSSSSSSSTPTLTKVIPNVQTLEIDIESASIDELREALRDRNKQIEELSNNLLRITEEHAADQTVWAEKIMELQKEVARKEEQIKALSLWMKNMHVLSSGNIDPNTAEQGSRTPSLLEIERERSDDSSRSSLPTPASSIRLPLHKILSQGEDSGADSNPTSNSDWGTSGAEDEAATKPRRSMRRLKLVESVNRSRSLKQPGSGALSLGSNASNIIPGSYLSKQNKHSSISSSNSFAASSASDSSPTSITFPAAQHLIPIPESRNIGSKENQVSLPSEKEELKRERKTSKISFKLSGQPSATNKPISQSKSIPSVTPGSRLTPSEAYVQNLKKGRPPSIAQVLDQTTKPEQPVMSGIEDSYGGRSRAILAGMDHSTVSS
ncbi:hypothetical protein GYMLUDRAFT_71900 [Collybiopsis luxurians FD-317 M1]|uniref:Uncharacterized protein n=1 Tax=Collybiopsis luxurians FD-317 M1 TaxID=944289 RepID=A0A0D0CVP2_9AGAR|nr:hypothetical protein GYMLUDRAFT_71900 [Collybiopsis luxurians FD-317 M1]